jgi:hypothetical protein
MWTPRGSRYATAVTGSRLCIYFLGNLRCNVIYLQYLPLPKSIKTSVNVFKEA